jgi:hypothetical protein
MSRRLERFALLLAALVALWLIGTAINAIFWSLT